MCWLNRKFFRNLVLNNIFLMCPAFLLCSFAQQDIVRTRLCTGPSRMRQPCMIYAKYFHSKCKSATQFGDAMDSRAGMRKPCITSPQFQFSHCVALKLDTDVISCSTRRKTVPIVGRTHAHLLGFHWSLPSFSPNRMAALELTNFSSTIDKNLITSCLR